MSRLRALWRENRVTLVALVAIAAAYLALRTPASPVTSASEVTAMLGQGKPMVLYFFTNT